MFFPWLVSTVRNAYATAAFNLYAARFDGSSYASQTASSLTGLANYTSGLCTMSFWVRFTGGDSSAHTFFQVFYAGDKYISAFRGSGGELYFGGSNLISSRTNVRSNSTLSSTDKFITSSSGWTHVLWVVDANTGSNSRLYINGVRDTTLYTAAFGAHFSGDEWPLFRYAAGSASPSISIGIDNTSGWLLNGDIAELWIKEGFYNDPTKFISNGSPVSLGSDGSTPTGNKPDLYFSRLGNGTSWLTDAANGNALTVSGSVTGSSSPVIKANTILYENFEGSGTPYGWTQSGTVNWHNSSSPISGSASMSAAGGTGSGYGYYDFAAQNYVEGYFEMVPNTLGSYYGFLNKAGGAADAGQLLRIYIDYNGSGSGLVQCIDGSGNGGSFTYLPNDTFVVGRKFYMWFTYERSAGVNWWISQTSTRPAIGSFSATGSNGFLNRSSYGSGDLAAARFIAGFYDERAYKMDNIILTSSRVIRNGGAIPITPAFDREVYRGATSYSGPASTDVHTLTAGITAGKFGIFMVVDNGLLSSVTDSRGNTWTLDATGGGWAFYSAPIKTSLVVGDTITVTYTSAFSGWRLVAVLLSAVNITAKDTSYTGAFTYSTSCTATVTTSAAALVIGGPTSDADLTTSETAVDGTATGNWYGMSSNNWIGARYIESSSAGTVSISSTFSGLRNLVPVAVAYK